MNKLCLALSLLFMCASALSQNYSDKAASQPPIPASRLVFSAPERTSLGATGTIMKADYGCADDGSVLLQIADAPQVMDMSLHALKGPLDDIRFSPPHLSGYSSIASWPVAYFSDSQEVAILEQAPIAQSQLEAERTPQTWAWLALLYDRKGTFEHAVPIPSDIEPVALGIYGSGDLLLVATNKTTKAADLVVLSPQGGVITHLLLFDDDYNTSKTAKRQQPFASLGPDVTFTSLQIAAHGDNLLLVPRMTSSPIIEVNEHGVIHTVPLQLPKGIAIAELLAQDGSLWTVRTYTNLQIETDSKTGQKSGSMHEEPVFVFNSFDGSLVHRIDLPAKFNGLLACEHNGDYTALTTDPKDGRLEVLSGRELEK